METGQGGEIEFSGPGALADRVGIVIMEAKAERAVGTMPVEGNTQPLGVLHGGASCVLAETLGSIAGTMHAAEVGGYVVGVDINATHHRSVRSGLVTGVASAGLYRPVDLFRPARLETRLPCAA